VAVYESKRFVAPGSHAMLRCRAVKTPAGRTQAWPV